jgi:integrase
MTFTNREGEEVEHPYVLPGDAEGKPIQDLRKFWRRLLKAAGIVNLTRHDLRHAHGNEAAGLGLNMQTTAALLGHHDPHTTARYSKTGQHPALEASEKVSGSLKAKMGKRGAK